MLRREHRVFRRRRFFRGQPATGSPGGPGDIVWLDPQGREVTSSYWRADGAKALAVFLNGDAITEPDPRGERITDDRFLLLFNAAGEPVTFTLPEARFGPGWHVYIDTCGPRVPAFQADVPSLSARAQLKVASRSVVVLCCPAKRS
jgi:isoamylase